MNRKGNPKMLQDNQNVKLGRPRSLPPAALRRVLTLRRSGFGYRSIANELRRAGIDVGWPTARRAVKRLPPYDDPETGDYFDQAMSRTT